MSFVTLFLLVLSSNFIVVIAESSKSIATSSLNGLPFTDSLNATCFGNDSVCPPWGYCDETSGTCKCFMKSNVLICDPNGVQNFILVGYYLTISDVLDELELALCRSVDLTFCSSVDRSGCRSVNIVYKKSLCFKPRVKYQIKVGDI